MRSRGVTLFRLTDEQFREALAQLVDFRAHADAYVSAPVWVARRGNHFLVTFCAE
jgi:hypothetical protein